MCSLKEWSVLPLAAPIAMFTLCLQVNASPFLPIMLSQAFNDLFLGMLHQCYLLCHIIVKQMYLTSNVFKKRSIWYIFIHQYSLSCIVQEGLSEAFSKYYGIKFKKKYNGMH